MDAILIPTIILGGIGLLLGLMLAVAGIFFRVKTDERIPVIEEALPGANCGGCGYAGCSAYARAIAEGSAPCDRCGVGGRETAEYIGKIMGHTVDFVPRYACVRCTGQSHEKFVYEGEEDCSYATSLAGGLRSCVHGCVGLGSCVKVCPSGAISVVDHRPIVDKEKCTGCGACARTCPHELIEIIPKETKVMVMCKSRDTGGMMKNTCSGGCIGCRICEKSCRTGAITVNNNFASIDYSKCVSCGTCVEKCPRKVIAWLG